MERDNDEPTSLSLRRSTRRSLPVSINNVNTESTPKGNVWKRSNTERRSEDSLKSKRIKLEKRQLRPPSVSQSHCSDDLSLPVRRSAREKRLIFANFTPQEITRTINQTAAIQMVATESSDEEMEPYERLLSPVNKRGPRKRILAHHLRCHGAVRNQDEEKEQKEREEEKEEEEKRPEGGGSNTEEPEASDEEEEEEEETSYYNLRKRRPIVYQYQPVLQVVDNQPRPERRNRQVRSTLYHHRSVAHSSYYSSSSRKNKHSSSSLHHKAHQNSSTSSSEDSDEARFQRRKSRSMRRARNECLPMNFTHDDAMSGPIRDRARIGASLADVSPMNIDQSISFDDIGGLKQHIRSLKEMIIFPLLYPEVFQRFKITPPRGVIFHGPPGCGKTLVARALANECSKGGRKVAFFMRKGADCLSKWVGESERQLRLLFDQAYQMRPSIIFFDEIDGLAPVRSSRQDQIHSSIVSTLLALMDGVDSRGEIVIIGATNRIDAIDPALRRPGRFDREFVFPLPSREDRSSILHIHTQHWDPPLKRSFLTELANHTVGYCGADLRALCTEAALFSLRRQYPQIYATSDKLVIDPTKITISAADFYSALKSIVPTTQRADSPQAYSLCDTVFPLLGEQFLSLLSYCAFILPQSWSSVCQSQQEIRSRLGREKEKELARKSEMPCIRPAQSSDLSCALEVASCSSASCVCTADKNCMQDNATNSSVLPYHAAQQSLPLRDIFFDSCHVLSDCGSKDILVDGPGSSSDDVTSGFLSLSSNPHMPPPPHRPHLLLAGQKGGGQSDYIAPALLHALEDFPLKTLDMTTLFGSSVRLPEEACTQVFREAQRVAPAVLYIPRVDTWWSVTSDTFRATFTYCILSLSSSCPLLVVCTAETPLNGLPDELYRLFSHPPPPTLSLPSLTQRQNFFHHIMLIKPLQSPPNIPSQVQEAELELLPVASPLKPRELSQEETEKLYRQREAVLRELRVFLREATNKLLAERKFKEFTKPVDRDEVQDYYEIIRRPMDLSTIMRKIDDHRYSLPSQWLNDVNLITKNALEYNPEHDLESRLLRHRAVALQDLAHSIFDHELSEEFEKQCEDIKSTLVRLGKEPPEPSLSSCDHTHSTPTNVSDSALLSSEPTRRSLRRLGVKPDTTGLPYYAPAKPRTPRKDSDTSQEMELVEEESSSRRLSIEKSATPSENIIASDLQSSSSPKHVIDVTEKECGSTAMRRLEFTPPLSEDEGVVQTDTGQTITDNDKCVIETTTAAAHSDAAVEREEKREVVIDKHKMVQLFEDTVEFSKNWSVEQMMRLHSTLEQLAFRHRLSWNRTGLLEDYKTAIQFC